MIHVPTPEEFEETLNINSNMGRESLAPVLQRDIARMIEIAHLVTDVGFLGTSAVLSGGMAMRLRGSSRLSIKDTDLSTTPDATVSDDDLRDVLEVNDPEISIVPGKVTTSAAGDTREVFPVEFVFRNPPLQIEERERRFRVDVAARGLDLKPEGLELRHEYPFEIGIEGILIPTIALPEAVAEKAFSFGAFRLAKHYADLAYAADHFYDELQAEKQTLRDLTALKLERNLRQFPGLMKAQRVSGYSSLQPPFVQDEFLRVVKFQWNEQVGYVGQASEHYSFNRALELVRDRLVPLLF